MGSVCVHFYFGGYHAEDSQLDSSSNTVPPTVISNYEDTREGKGMVHQGPETPNVYAAVLD